jgi:hypothetical protein
MESFTKITYALNGGSETWKPLQGKVVYLKSLVYKDLHSNLKKILKDLGAVQTEVFFQNGDFFKDLKEARFKDQDWCVITCQNPGDFFRFHDVMRIRFVASRFLQLHYDEATSIQMSLTPVFSLVKISLYHHTLQNPRVLFRNGMSLPTEMEDYKGLDAKIRSIFLVSRWFDDVEKYLKIEGKTWTQLEPEGAGSTT